MKVAELQAYGGAEALHVVDRDKPSFTNGSLLIRNAATSLNPFDIAKASGALKALFPLSFPYVPGSDFAGVVVGIASGESNFAIGDHVFGETPMGGAYAEFVVADPAKVALKPTRLTYAGAASLAIVGQTALQALDAANLKNGQTLLVHGLGGAIGSIVVQLLRGGDIKLIGTASPRHHKRLISEGAAMVFDPRERFEDLVKEVDAAIDCVGQGLQERTWAMLKPKGILVALNQLPSQDEAQRHHVCALMLKTDVTPSSLTRLCKLIDAGIVNPRIGSCYSLANVAQAWKNVSSDRLNGKTVITMF